MTGLLGGKRVLVHFGAHKTASSALQHFMRFAAGRSADTTFLGPNEIRGGARPLRRLLRLHQPRTAERLSDPPLQLIEYLSSLPTPHLVISEENLLGRMPGRDRGIYPSVEHTAALIGHLRDAGADVTGLLFVREQVSLLQSSFLFRVPLGEACWADAYFDAARHRSLSWYGVAAALREALGDGLHVVPYEALSQDFEGVREYLGAVDPVLADLRRLRRVNTSLQTVPLFVFQTLRSQGMDLDVSAFKQACRELQKHICHAWNEGAPIDSDTESLVLDFVRQRLNSCGEDWIPATRAAITLHQYLSAAGVDPMRASDASMRTIRAACRQDNQHFVREFLPERWQSLWP